MKNRVEEYRKRKNMTQKNLENITGIRQSTISRIEKGKPVMVDTAKIIARALDSTVEELWPD